MSRLDPATWSQTYPNQPGHVHGSRTSRAAAQSMRPKMGEHHTITLRAFREAGTSGLTDEQLDRDWAWRANYAKTLRPRRIELTAQGYLADSGMRRPTISGRQATVWIIRDVGTTIDATDLLPPLEGERVG